TRPFYWSVRRELWENRSLYLGPLIVAGFVLLGLLVQLHGLPERRRAALLLDPVKARHAIEMPYDAAIGMLVLAAFVLGAFYCLDALYGERRDRSILFWKSLPVSDLTAVLAKITVPLVVLPLICMPISICVHLIWLLLSSIALLMGGVSPATTFEHVPLFQLWVAMIYSWIAMVLWHAPIYTWLLVVSAWARRTTFLWAVLPFVAIGIFERVAFSTTYVNDFVRYRLLGWFFHAFAMPEKDTVVEPLAQLTPGRYLSTPGLWLGVIFAAACLYAAVRLRRYRGPV
ncbi:MAG: ABC transporter permease, partial [Chthoniobacterales bacterium]|nr:ABC transporter permease [Chthoniobacterales bacterium]